MQDNFIKAEDLSKVLGISLSTLYRGVKSNKYPYSCNVKLPGGRILFPQALITELTKKAFNNISHQTEGQNNAG